MSRLAVPRKKQSPPMPRLAGGRGRLLHSVAPHFFSRPQMYLNNDPLAQWKGDFRSRKVGILNCVREQQNAPISQLVFCRPGNHRQQVSPTNEFRILAFLERKSPHWCDTKPFGSDLEPPPAHDSYNALR